ncbi:hypothetical protein DSO57_1037547 [Entomophthora muscae]|uniref:Uncharacterized protein n=1 Tax=Entomophthora muscae TaxID=34485 RepID=A0ACC2S0W0_9FUNG|nr:hypothetical protein DSO57_1037547 [Entomophthora muscae]
MLDSGDSIPLPKTRTMRRMTPPNSDSSSSRTRMVPYPSDNNLMGPANPTGFEVHTGMNSFFSYTPTSLAPPFGPGGQELLNKSSGSDGSADSDAYSQTSSGEKLSGASIYTFPGIYSSSGFDVLGILAKIVTRPNPLIQIGPVDMNASFVVVDARKYDFPIIYASNSFEKLTGYTPSEVVGRNCRFLQSPDGHVSLGSRRRYTDNTVVHRIKSQIIQGKEYQTSIVNYKKNGQPFINLITAIPIFEDEEIMYYVGFQVDLVEQPNSMLESLKDGSYQINYNMLTLPKYLSSGLDDFFPGFRNSGSYQNAADAYESIVGKPRDEESHRIWNRMLIEHTDDFIHVLTLKGVFLYASPSSQVLLGYKPEEIVGYSVSMLCHSSDLVPMMRELKDITSASSSFCLIYRARHKNGSFIWMEAIGRLHNENGKGRKCVVLSARPRPVLQLSQEAVTACGGLDSREFWSKLSLDGLFLYVTSACQEITGIASDELVGTSMYQYMRSDRTTALTRALHQTRDGVTVRLRHFFKNDKNTYSELTSTFYPGDTSNNGKPAFILCQTRACDKNTTPDSGSDASFSSSSAPSPCTNRAASEYDNMFDALDAKRNTTWHFELHQLRLANKKLQDEILALQPSSGLKRKQPSSQECSQCQSRKSNQWYKSSTNSSQVNCYPCHQSNLIFYPASNVI